MTLLLTLLTALTIPLPVVEVETLDGVRYSGQLQAMSDENVHIETVEGKKRIPVDQLMGITFPKNDQKTSQEAKFLVTLVDSSHIVVDEYHVKDGKARFFSGNSQAITVPTHDVSAVRFSNTSENLEEAWNRLRKNATDSDRLVIAKGDSLDYHSGSLGEVTGERIVFTLDESDLKIKREKIFGLTYYHPAGRLIPEPLGRLTTADGTRWAFVSVKTDLENLTLKTPLGLQLSLPMERIKRLDFAEGKVVYLSDILPESIVWTPYMDIKDDDTGEKKTPSRATLFGPKFNRSFETGPLVLDGKAYTKGLAIHSRSVIIYRLDKKYGRLTATVGIADRVRPRGNVQLKIEADGQLFLDREISGKETAVPLDLDLARAERLKIIVDFGRQTDIADRLILGDAKVIK